MTKKIWIAGIWGDGGFNMVSGLEKDLDVEVIRDDFTKHEKLRKAYNVIRTRLRGHGRYILYSLLETRIWDKYYKLSSCHFEENEQNYIVIFNSAITQYYSYGYFKRLKKKHKNLKTILYIVDPMPNGMLPRLNRIRKIFDKVLTMQLYNTKRYGIDFFQCLYTPITVQMGDKKRDLYYCGVVDSYRYELLHKMVNICNEKNIRFEMHFFKAESYPVIDSPSVHYGQVPYDQNVQKANESNCILEIVRKDFVGITQRYYEAIVYNRKLLTNNPEIKDMSYYNEEYMQYFESLEDIDWDWVRNDIKVDYNYQGDFSPKQWKEKLLKIMEKEIYE